jgi:hypothetical protein
VEKVSRINTQSDKRRKFFLGLPVSDKAGKNGGDSTALITGY